MDTRKIIDCEVLWNTSFDSLNKTISFYLKDNWQPLGPACSGQSGGSSKEYPSITMVKYEETSL